MRLQTKILLLLIPLIVLPLLALGWAAYMQMVADARMRTEQQMSTVLEQIRVHTETQLKTARANARLFAGSERLQEFMLSGSRSGRKERLAGNLRDQLFDNQLAYPEYYDIRVLDAEGRELLRAAPVETVSLRDDGFPAEILDRMREHVDINYTTYFRDPTTEKIALLVSKPLWYDASSSAEDKSRSRELYGFLTISVDLEYLKSYVAEKSFGKYGRVFVTDGKGEILFHPQRGQIGTRLPDSLFGKMGWSGSGGVYTSNYQGEASNYSGIKLDDKLYVIATYPEYEIGSESVALARIVAFITVLAIVLTTAFLFGILRSLLVRPIQKLGAAAREMGRGQVLVPIDVKSSDEIGDLARTFREMGTNLERHHEEVRYVAYHDSLTGLPNRMMFKEYLERATAEAKRNLQELAILFLDLDNFKRINDTLGHQAGDRLLEIFADRLSGCLRDTDVVAHTTDTEAAEVVARLAGDEFIVLLPRTTGAKEAQTVAKRILRELEEPFVIEHQELYISTSIGIALFPDDGLNANILLKNADIAMYHAKKLGRNNYQYYSRQMNEEAMQRLKIESKLRHAVERSELVLHYQPQINVETGRLSGVEALLRWEDAELGKVSPEIFIPIAEEYGLIIPISEWVVREACRQASAWRATGLPPFTMSINVSGVHFNAQELETLIGDTIRETGIDPSMLELELTETSILQDPELAVETLNSLKALGPQISLDDFGTGYSSLSYVMKLPIDKLKIDQSFIRDIDHAADSQAIVTAIIAMAHSLEMEVIAEGVEQQAHLDFLRERNCDIVQGFYLGRPMPADQLEAFAVESSARSA